MPSNLELENEALALSEELGLEVDTKGLKNDQLAELVSDLKAKKTDVETDTGADVAQKQKPKGKLKKPPFYLAPRCSVTTKRGILSGDSEDEISAEDLAGGEKALKAFIASGHVLKGG